MEQALDRSCIEVIEDVIIVTWNVALLTERVSGVDAVCFRPRESFFGERKTQKRHTHITLVAP